jgi:hypothetical protein
MSVKDLWSRWVDWFVTSDNSKYQIAFEQVGGNDIDLTDGTAIPAYIFIKNGWRIRPQEADHTLKVSEGVLVVDGGGDPFVDTLGAYTVRLNYQQPVQAITIATGGGSSGPTASQIADAVWDRLVPVTPLSGSYGDFIANKLLSVAKFLGLK